MRSEVLVVAIVKGEERFLFLYRQENACELIRQVGRMASNPDMNFSWYDAAIVANKVRQNNESESNQSS